MNGNMDKLHAAVARRGPVCVGLDTDLSYLPEGFARPELTAGENILRFNRAVIDATKDAVACFKVQIAYYEALGLDGLLPTKRPSRRCGPPGGWSSRTSSGGTSPRPPRCTPVPTLRGTSRRTL